jgi:hypothetical protein
MSKQTISGGFVLLRRSFRLNFSDAAKERLNPLITNPVPPVSFTVFHAAFIDPVFKSVLG